MRRHTPFITLLSASFCLAHATAFAAPEQDAALYLASIAIPKQAKVCAARQTGFQPQFDATWPGWVEANRARIQAGEDFMRSSAAQANLPFAPHVTQVANTAAKLLQDASPETLKENCDFLLSELRTVPKIAYLRAHPLSAAASGPQRPLSFDDTSLPYGRRVGDAIRFHLLDPGPVAADSLVEVEVLVQPDGTVSSYKLLRTAGSPQWEAAVKRAMARADRLPLDVAGKVPARLVLTLRP